MSEKQDSFGGCGITTFLGRVEADSGEDLAKSLTRFYERGLRKVIIAISSGGGDARIAMNLYDIIRVYPGEVTGLVVGQAMSAAALMLQACHRRMALPHSRVLIHHGTCTLDLDCVFRPWKLKKFIDQQKALLEADYRILCSRTKKTRAEIQALSFENRAMSADEAVEFGLLDGIWAKPLPPDLITLGQK